MGRGGTNFPVVAQTGRRKARPSGVIFLIVALLQVFAVAGAAAAEPKRVLLLHSLGRDFAPWAEFAVQFRAELERTSPQPVEFFDAALMTERLGADQDEGPFSDYLRALFAGRRLDLVVAIGASAARFVQQRRTQLFPSTPILFTAIEQRRIPPSAPAANDAVMAVSIDHAAVIRNILDVLPDTTGIAVVIGRSPIEQYWLEQLRRELQPFTSRVTLTWLSDLSLDGILKRSAALPPKSAVYFFSLVMDAAGSSHEGGKVLTSLRTVSSAPIFNFADTDLGRGIVGGPLISVSSVAQQAAAVATRVLGGEPAGSITTPPAGAGLPKFDWRELQRWNISEARLPLGSEVYFREPRLWDRYRWPFIAVSAAVLLQAGLIAWLLLERRRRSLAEAEAGNRRREAIHLNRVATATVLSSSLAHELSQPLGAILINAETARHMLKGASPDLREVDEILSDVIRDDQRASDIVHSQKSFLKKDNGTGLQVFDLNDSVREVVDIAASEAAKRGVALSAGRSAETLPIRADRVQMQQVILNLVMNGLDALQDCDAAARTLKIQTSRNRDSTAAELTVSDSGNGVPADKLRSIFDAFVTTKPDGTGLGLPIARTIVEIHGGTIWAENRRDGGAAFHVTVPLAANRQTPAG